MPNIDAMTVRQIATGVADGTFSAVEIARSALDAIASREPEVQAFLQVTPELALGRARRRGARIW